MALIFQLKKKYQKTSILNVTALQLKNLFFQTPEYVRKNIYFLHVQQTPKPLAQSPALVPPLFEHSSLEKLKRIIIEMYQIESFYFFVEILVISFKNLRCVASSISGSSVYDTNIIWKSRRK